MTLQNYEWYVLCFIIKVQDKIKNGEYSNAFHYSIAEKKLLKRLNNILVAIIVFAPTFCVGSYAYTFYLVFSGN